jgi:hypothetical protein
MHRSGTSALTRGLQALQVGLGDQLNPGNFANPKGYWEDEDIMRLNESVLAALGSSYHHFGLLKLAALATPAFEALKHEAIELLRNKLVDSNIWAFKDPRTCRLLPFWQTVFRELDCSPSYVISVRNPISVAHSLSKRDHFDPIKSYYLWLEHLLGALVETKSAARVIVDYDLLLENPALQLSRIAKRIDLPLPDSEAIRKYEEEFLEKDLRHTLHTLDELVQDPDVPAPVIKLHRLLQTFTTDEADPEDPAAAILIDEVFKEWQITEPALRLINKQTESNFQQPEHQAALTKAHVKSAFFLENVLELEKQNEELRSHCKQYQQHVDHLDDVIRNLNERVLQLSTEAGHLKQQLDIIQNSKMWRIARRLKRTVGVR